MARKIIEKKLSYRLPVSEWGEDATLLSMREHWQGFTWMAGPWVVKWLSDTYCQVQVWAENEEEGKRVARHALAHMAAPEEAGEWQVSRVSDSRYGRICRVAATVVSARARPHGVVPFLDLWRPTSTPGPTDA